jgi:MFS family permease
LLWSGQTLSTTGDAIQYIALPLLMLALTHSAVQAGIVATLETLPFPLLCLPAGVLVDRWDRKHVMLLCDTVRALVTGSIPVVIWFEHPSIFYFSLVALVSGILSTFFSLAETAALPNVVNKEQLAAAMGQNYAASTVSGMIGPPVGGFLYALGSACPFLANAVSYVISVLSLRCIRVPFQQQRQVPPGNFLAEIREGITWIRHHPLVRLLALRVSAGNLVYGGSTLLLIVLATEQHASAFAIGVMFTIEAFGGIAASLLIERVQRRWSFAHITIGLGWITALLFPLYALAPNVVILGLIGAILSFLLVLFDVTQLSYRASIIPDTLFGRVTGSIRLLTVGALSLGATMTGTLLQTIGPRPTVLVLTIYLLLLALATTVNRAMRPTPHSGAGEMGEPYPTGVQASDTRTRHQCPNSCANRLLETNGNIGG